MNKNLGGYGKEFKDVAMKPDMFGMSSSAIVGLSKYGIGLKEFSSAYAGLNNSINNFNNLSDEQRKSLATNASQFEKLGLSAQTYGSLVVKMMGTMNITTKQAEVSINKLGRAAQASGRNIGQYISEFERLRGQLVGFSQSAEDVFNQLNAISQATGGLIKPDALISLNKSLYSLDGMMNAGRDLRMIFGEINVDLKKLASTDPSTQFLELKRAVEETGQSMDDLTNDENRWKLNKLADTLFGGDREAALAMINTPMKDILANMEKRKKREEELKGVMMASASIASKFNTLIEKIAISFEPILKLVDRWLTGAIKIQGKLGGVGTIIAVTLPSAVVLLGKAFSFMIGNTSRDFTKMFAAIETSLGAIKKQIAEISLATNGITGAVASSAAPAAVTAATSSTAATTVGAATGGGFLAKMAMKFPSVSKFVSGAFALFKKRLGWILLAMSALPLLFGGSEEEKPKIAAKSKKFAVEGWKKTEDGDEENIPQKQAFNATSTKPLYTRDMATGRLKMVAKGAYNDQFNIQAATPEERAREQLLVLSPIKSSLEKITASNNNTYSQVNNTQARMEKYTTEINNATQSSRDTLTKQTELLAEKIVTGISTIKVNTQLHVGKLEASINPKDVKQIIKDASDRGASLALKAPFSRDTNLVTGTGV